MTWTVTIKLLSEELSTAVSAHDIIQSQIDELLVDDSAAFDLEVIERDKHCELHTELRRTLMLIEERHQLWSNSNCVVEEMDTLSAVSDKTSPSFRSMFENFSNNCKPFLNSARAHHAHPAFRERLQSLHVARDKLCRHACTSSESSSPVLSFPHPSCSIPKGAPIPVKVPSFDGNPLHWEKYESEFSTAIRTRAPHYSNFDVRCLLTESVVPIKAKNIIKHHPDRDAPLADLLRALKREFGTPVIVGPILLEKLLTHNTYDLDYSGFSNLSEHFIQPYDSLVSLIGDSLSTFMALLAKKCLSTSCRMEWEKFTKDIEAVPDMDHFKSFIETWQKVLIPTEFPLAGVTTTPSQSHPSSSSTSSASMSKYRPRNKSPPRRTMPGCPACKEPHDLLKCPTFLSYDVDRRNKLVREHHLCINCFSALHGFKQCPNRFSCKTCGARYHTLLHRDRDSASAPHQPSSPPTPTPAWTAATPPSADQITTPTSRFLHTVTETLVNDGNSVKARAILDTGAAVSMMIEKTASDLKLKRSHNPIQVAGTTGTTHCKFSV